MSENPEMPDDVPNRRDSGLWRRMVQLPWKLLDSLATFSRAAERRWHAILGRAQGVTEVADRADGLLGRFGIWLSWPFQRLFGSLDATGKLAVGKKSAIFVRILIYPVRAMAGFLSAFWSTRRLALLRLGIPLVVLAVPVAVLIYAMSAGQGEALPRRYREAFEQAVMNRQFSQAELYRQKLQQLGQPFEQLGLRAADDLFDSGQVAEAFAMVEKIAPPAGGGVPAGHFWLARKHLGEKLPPGIDGDSALEAARVHLEHLRTLQAGGLPEVVILESLVAMREGNLHGALEVLKRGHEKSVFASGMRMELLQAMGKQEELVDESKVFLGAVRGTPRLAEEAGAELFPVWLLAENLAGDRWSQGEVLSVWIRRFPGDAMARDSFAVWQMEALDSVGPDTTESEIARLVCMLDEVSRMPGADSRKLFSGRMAWIRAHSLANPALLQVLNGLGQLEKPASPVLEFFGTEAAVAGDFATAEQFLQLATQASAGDHVAWNNLAFVIWKRDPSRSEAALEAVERSLRLNPGNMEAIKTRGMILLELQQWQRAVDDLEVVLSGKTGDRGIHAGLALAYEQLGNAGLAEVHRRRAKSLSSR